MVKKLQALKAKKGFTLVELIVVIAIIGVLAAILVPTLMNQVTKANVTSADSTAKELLGTVNTWLVENNTAGGSLAKKGAFSISGTTATGFTGTGNLVETVKNPVSFDEKLRSDYSFDSTMKAKVWIDNTGKAVACQFTAKAAAAPTDVFSQAADGTVTAVATPWKSNDGKNDGVNANGIIVGTSPKITTGAAAST